MKTSESINMFLNQPHIAVVGVSRNKNKFGNAVYHILKKKGIKVFPVNPHLTHFEGEKCYSNIETLPADVTADAQLGLYDGYALNARAPYALLLIIFRESDLIGSLSEHFSR